MTNPNDNLEQEAGAVVGGRAYRFTLSVPVGDGAVMTVVNPASDPHLEWMLRYSDYPAMVRFVAAAVVESYAYLLSDAIPMKEATRRLSIMRGAVASLKTERSK